jgi:dTDP-D-glucose 4,6-dehydratase
MQTLIVTGGAGFIRSYFVHHDGCATMTREHSIGGRLGLGN